MAGETCESAFSINLSGDMSKEMQRRVIRWEIGSQVGVKQDCYVLPLMTQNGQDGTGNLQSSFTKGQANKTEVCMLQTLAKKLVGGLNDKYECGASRLLKDCM